MGRWVQAEGRASVERPDVGERWATIRTDRRHGSLMRLERGVRAGCGVFKPRLRSLHIILRAIGSP